ncbi:MAG: hypothetical protein LBU32_03400 [Clostridiales bacterium]|nr:hypothetical protein [Clostridiales bacterium]
MVVYYSWKLHTKAYAQELASITNDSIFPLEEKSPRKGIIGWIKGGYQGLTKNHIEVKSLPVISAEKEIYICSPVWASDITPAVRYFIKRMSLKGKRVNFLLTCANIEGQDKYKKNALDALSGKGCKPGPVLVFATGGGEAPDSQTIRRQLEDMLPQPL